MFHRNTLTWLSYGSMGLYIFYAFLPFEENDLNELFSIELIDKFSGDGLVVDKQSIEFNY